jgi:hypothetical protein
MGRSGETRAKKTQTSAFARMRENSVKEKFAVEKSQHSIVAPLLGYGKAK